VQLRPAATREPLVPPEPEFTKVQLKSPDEQHDAEPEQAVQAGPTTVTETKTSTTTTTSTVKRIVKDPEYETVEYKIGCVCTVL
jgi:hypothetical protein